jgi:hypothetical protein
MLDIHVGNLLDHGFGQLRGGVPYDMEYLPERLDSEASGWVIFPGNGLQASSLQFVCDLDSERFIDHLGTVLRKHRRATFGPTGKLALPTLKK